MKLHLLVMTTILILISAFSNQGYAIGTDMCIGNNIESMAVTLDTAKPVVSITSEKNRITEGKELILDTAYRVDSLHGGQPFFYWCTTQGTLESVSADYSSVKFIAPTVPENGTAVQIRVWIADNLGYEDRDTLTLIVEDKPTLSSVIIKTADKITGDIELISRGIDAQISTIKIVKVNGQQVDGRWNDQQPDILVSSPFSNDSLQLNIQKITGFTSVSLEQPVQIEAYDYLGDKIVDVYYPFIDVAPERLYTNSVLTLWKNGVVEGYQGPDHIGHFGPDNDATRAEFLKAALKAAQPDVQYPKPSEKDFNDVEIAEWYSGYIHYAKENGIVVGCRGGFDFCPNDSITQAEAAKIIVKLLADCNELFTEFQQDRNPLHTFSDVTNPFDWYYPYIYTVIEAGIFTTENSDLFKPNRSVKRSELAEMIYTAFYGSPNCSSTQQEPATITFNQLNGDLLIVPADSSTDLTSMGTIFINDKSVIGTWMSNGISFNLYSLINKNFKTFWDPVQLEIHDFNGAEIYSGCFPFKDVCAGDWYTRPVMKLWQEGISHGYEDGTGGLFGVGNDSTRAEAIKMTVGVLESPDTLENVTTSPFADVPADKWYAKYIAYAKKEGWVQGCDSANNLFCPDDSVNRVEAAKIISLGLHPDLLKEMKDGRQPEWLFTDVQDLEEWYYPFVYTLQTARAVQGSPNDTLYRPADATKREELAKMVCVAGFGEIECTDMDRPDEQ